MYLKLRRVAAVVKKPVPGSIRRALLLVSCLVGPVLSTACSKFVYEHDGGRLSRGSFLFMKNIYYQGQFEEEETLAKRNQAIVDDMATVEGIGALAKKKGILDDPSYSEYMFRQARSRHAKAAIWFWQQKYKEKFNWQMLFSAEKLSYDEKSFARSVAEAIRSAKPIEDLYVASFEGKPIVYKNLRSVMSVSDYAQLPALNEAAMLSGMRDVLKAWLEKQIHDRVTWSMSADEAELRRFDHNRVSTLYLKVRYGKAGKGIYPGSMDKIPLTATEIYDHYHKLQNTLADVLWVKAAYTVVADDNRAEEVMEKLEKGANLAELAAKYASEPKFIKTASPMKIMGYDRRQGVDAREKREYYDRLIIDMAARDVTKPEPYLGKDGVVIVQIYEVSRSLEKVKLQDVSWKVENDLRTKMLNSIYEPDIKDAREKLHFKFNQRLIDRLN